MDGRQRRYACVSAKERHEARQRRERAKSMPPTEIERRRRAAVAEQEQHPRHAAADEVGSDHAPDAPALEVCTLHERIELDPGAGRARAASRGRCPP